MVLMGLDEIKPMRIIVMPIRTYQKIFEKIMEHPSTRSLNTTNPDHIEYRHGLIDITVLGGVRLEGLDRLRVTLKIQV
jgi:hypothetical protein